MRNLISALALIFVVSIGDGQADSKAERKDISKLSLRLPCGASNPGRWQAGLHYNVLLPYAPTYVTPEHVEIREQSMYTTWITPDEFREKFKEWLKRNAAHVTYTLEPSIADGMPHARLQARMFYTLEALKRGDLHEPFRAWIQDSKERRRWEIYHNVSRPDEKEFLKLNLEFIKENEIDERIFLDTYNSEETARKVRRAEAITGTAVVQGTPTFVVNGRYSVSAQRLFYSTEEGEKVEFYFSKLLELIDYLVSAELKCASDQSN